MLIPYRKEYQKIALGFLSFHAKMKQYGPLLKELDWYEQQEHFHLYFWAPDDSKKIQGIVGVSDEKEGLLVLHDISISPSFRGEGYGFLVLDEVNELYPDRALYGTVATTPFLSKWEAQRT